jgi:hypothetical protein
MRKCANGNRIPLMLYWDNCPWVPKLWVSLLRGWGICLTVMLQSSKPEKSTGVDWGLSGGSIMWRLGSKEPIGASEIFE